MARLQKTMKINQHKIKQLKTKKLKLMRNNPEKYVAKSQWYCYDDYVEQNGTCPFLRMKEISRAKYKKLREKSGGFFVIDSYYINGNKCKVQYCALMKGHLTIQDEVKCCGINTDYRYAKYDPFYTYDWFVEEINSNPALMEKDSREAVEVVFFSDDYREITYSYWTSIKWAKGIYSDKFCRDHKIKFRFNYKWKYEDIDGD